MTPPASEELERELVDWLASLTGTDDLTITRRTGGASRAGYTVDARRGDGTTRALAPHRPRLRPPVGGALQPAT